MKDTIKIKNKKKLSKKSKIGGVLKTKQNKSDMNTLNDYLKSIIEVGKLHNKCQEVAGTDCKLVGNSSKSEQVILICKGKDMVLKGPPTSTFMSSYIPFDLEFSDDNYACIKMNSSTMNLLIQSVIKNLFEKDENKFSGIEHYELICSSTEGVFKYSPYFLVGKKFHYCPKPKLLSSTEDSPIRRSESSESLATVDTVGTIDGGGFIANIKNLFNDNTSTGESEREQIQNINCPSSINSDSSVNKEYIDNGKKGGFETLDKYLKGLRDLTNPENKLEIITEKIIKPIFQKLDILFLNIQFHHVDPKAHQIFLEGSGENLNPILGDLDKVSFTLNINETPYRMRTIRNRSGVKSRAIVFWDLLGNLNKITKMRYECLPNKNNNLEKLGFLASICILAPNLQMAEDIRKFGLNLIYTNPVDKNQISNFQLKAIIDDPLNSKLPTLKKFENEINWFDDQWRKTNSSIINKQENSLGYSFSFVYIPKEYTIEPNEKLESIVTLRKKIVKTGEGKEQILYNLDSDKSKIIPLPYRNSSIEESSPADESEATQGRKEPRREGEAREGEAREEEAREEEAREEEAREEEVREGEATDGVIQESASDAKNEELRYVLWVRHCEACHNVASTISLYNEQPLCTIKGIAEAYTFGQNFNKINKSISEIIQKNKRASQGLEEVGEGQEEADNKYSLYSSVLARAMQTCKIMSIGIKEKIRTFNDQDKITRIIGIQELDKDMRSGANIISKELSDKSCKFLNENIKDGVQINCNTIIKDGDKIVKPEEILKISKSKDLEMNYLKFKEILFDPNKFKPENIQCIVSHSAYIKDIMKLPYRLNNLDAVFCIYKRNANGFSEKEKYLFLFEDLIKKDNEKAEYYDLNDDDEKKRGPIIDKTGIGESFKDAIGRKKIRYGNKDNEINQKDLKLGFDYANGLFKGCEKFKNCGYKTEELLEEDSCNKIIENMKRDEAIKDATQMRQDAMLRDNVLDNSAFLEPAQPDYTDFPVGGRKKNNKKTKNKKMKKIKKFTKNIRKKKNKKTKKGRKKKYTKKNK